VAGTAAVEPPRRRRRASPPRRRPTHRRRRRPLGLSAIRSGRQREATAGLYDIGQRIGLDRLGGAGRVSNKLGKAVEALTSREASSLISQWLDQ